MIDDIWQPIATAPRDGTEVMVWDGRWHRILHWFSSDFDGGWINEDGASHEGATHWRPLPKGPTP